MGRKHWSGGLVLIAGFVGVFSLATAARTPQATGERSVYVTVLDSSGRPLTGLGVQDFGIKEDNVIREVTAVKPATDPLFLSVLVDTTPNVTNSVQELRTAVSSFVHDILAANPENKVSIGEFGGQAMTDVKFTSKAEDLDKFIPKIFPKPSGGSVLFEGLIDAGNNMQKATSPRRAIVTINMEPEEETSQMPVSSVAKAIQKGGASVWGISVQGIAAGGNVTDTTSTTLGNTTGRNPNTDVLLSGLAQNTGGARIVLMSSAALEGQLKALAAVLNSQYLVTFTRPAGAKPAKDTVAGVARPGAHALTLRWATGK
jgi:VWFA-related protein